MVIFRQFCYVFVITININIKCRNIYNGQISFFSTIDICSCNNKIIAAYNKSINFNLIYILNLQ